MGEGMSHEETPRLSADEHRLTTCVGKHGYKNGAEAGQAKRRLKRKHSFGGGGSIYRCQYCSHWHIGPTPRRKKGRRLKVLHH